LWKKGVSLAELKTWTYEEVLKANAILDMEESTELACSEMDKEDLEKT